MVGGGGQQSGRWPSIDTFQEKKQGGKENADKCIVSSGQPGLANKPGGFVDKENQIGGRGMEQTFKTGARLERKRPDPSILGGGRIGLEQANWGGRLKKVWREERAATGGPPGGRLFLS